MQGLARLAAGWLSFDLGSGGFTGRGAFALGAVKFVATLARSSAISGFFSKNARKSSEEMPPSSTRMFPAAPRICRADGSDCRTDGSAGASPVAAAGAPPPSPSLGGRYLVGVCEAGLVS